MLALAKTLGAHKEKIQVFHSSCHFVFFSPGSSQIQLVGSADPVVALAGDNVILPCYLEPNVSAVDKMVEWTRSDLKPQRVHLYREGRDSDGEQLPSYRGRTSLFKEELKNSNVSLKLTGVTLSDAGDYKCFIPTLKETTIPLIVGAVSQPVISVLSCICRCCISAGDLCFILYLCRCCFSASDLY
ncbi:unnamed protein product [Oncorhynchus mykiss]|uniref:Ig-like domain-containing protein n=1 Tax=Oncorhynchus mykiss TaxID=8022 RepID=A0A060ZB37_ONCMY|nr:unnamed protein product [Oncorhynchus mykiss]